MNVANIMTRDPITAPYNMSVEEALEIMQTHGFHHLPVISRNHHVIGIVTDRDCEIILQLPNNPENVNGNTKTKSDDEIMLVHEVMRPLTVVAEPSMSASKLARLMLENHVTCLPVMLEETLVGIVTTSDLLTVIERIIPGYAQGV